jgi:hypothetical protein
MIIKIVITLIVIGILLWLVNFIPMDAKIKQVINIFVVIVVVIWLLKVSGLLSYLGV